MRPTPKKLILGLLLASQGRPLSVRAAIAACALFDITENNVRVSLVRLAADGLIQASGRGAYVLGPNAQDTAAHVATWQQAEELLEEWQGAYVVAQCGHLGRSNRKALKRRQRAFEMLGMRELEKGLYIRPDNMVGGIEKVRQRLFALGVDRAAVVFQAQDFSQEHHQQITHLWNGEELNRLYTTEQAKLQAWLEQYADIELEAAARESYLLGGQAIRHVVFDPWLPPPLVDTEARAIFLETVKRFDETGKAIWQQLFSLHDDLPAPFTSNHFSPGVLQ